MSNLPLKFDAQGLVPTIVQDHVTGQIRMFAFASQAAVRKTLETRKATFWSRSRGELWQKGRVSGQEIPVIRILADCDADCIVYSSDPLGPSCHSGAPSCFFQTLDGDGERLAQASEPPQTVLAAVEASIPPPGRAHDSTVGPKIVEAAEQLARGLERESNDRIVAAAADTIYALLVGLRSRSIGLRPVLVEMARRSDHGAEDDSATPAASSRI
ncbi:MAG: phosphoribosyl-AMP cyclohydrolase [Polyangiaceae bacterium]|jgi:phosphoribosyl-ATP pyrophosphohydrolase/phosphoribosyl-AMP cyclohydrolase